MRAHIVVGLLLLGGIGVDAMADCSEGGYTRVAADNIVGTLSNKLVCATRVVGTDKWAEEHFGTADSDNNLWEHAKGSNDTVDPRHLVGTWGIVDNSNDGLVHYEYTGDGNFDWSLWINGTSVKFCDTGGESAIATGTLNTMPSDTATNPCSF